MEPDSTQEPLPRRDPKQRNQNACDACRSRKVKCKYTGCSDSPVCEGCNALNISCTRNRPRRRRGPANRHATTVPQHRENASPASSESPWPSSSGADMSPTSSIAASLPLSASGPPPPPPPASPPTARPSRSSPVCVVPPSSNPGPWLSLLGSAELIDRVLNDWFEFVHPLAPILHRRRFLQRLHRGDADVDRQFCALVISVCAATVGTLWRKSLNEYSFITTERCFHVIESQQLLPTDGDYTLDWCITKYNLAMAKVASVNKSEDMLWGFRTIIQAEAGIKYLVATRLDTMSPVDQELLKRLYWLVVVHTISADMFGQPYLGLMTVTETISNLRPQPLTDQELDSSPSFLAEAPPWHGDDTTYVPGLNHLVDIFLVWHYARIDRLYKTPEETLRAGLDRVQAALDCLPRELRWRGGLSRPTYSTWGHDAQIANLLVTSLHVKSTLLQHYGHTSDTEHQNLVSDLIEVLYHIPRPMLEANGFSLIPKMRDIGAAYLSKIQIEPGVIADPEAKEKLEKLLCKLEELDYPPGNPALCSPDRQFLGLEGFAVSFIDNNPIFIFSFLMTINSSSPFTPIIMGGEALATNSKMDLPHIRHSEKGKHFILKGKPYLMLAGELHNSSLSSSRYMEEVWPAMKAQSINTLLGSVTWEMIEPVEGTFDFTELDAVITGARKYDIHLVLLWFGTWKNGISTYAPGWVKKDVKRFPRVHVLEAGGVKRTLEMVSPLSEECCQADSRAFATLMQHLKDFDGDHNTVIMVQVENETGLLGDSRDRSAIAEKAFREPIPRSLLEHLASQTTNLHPKLIERFGPSLPTASQLARESDLAAYTWDAVFGPGVSADEAFMAHHISTYVGRVAAAGKAVYPIPLYTNTWLNFDDPSALDLTDLPVVVGGGANPGVYPSGGPCPHVLDIWRHNTPALDLLAPDLYFHDYEGVCRDYTAHADNELFIPEQRRDENGSRRVWLAYATYSALGCSPFGIDTGAETVGREYKLLEQTKQYLLGSKPEQRFGFFFDPKRDGGASSGKEVWKKRFGDLEVIVERAFVFGKPGPGGGMIIQLGDDPSSTKFLCVGRGFQVRFRSFAKGATFTGILYAEEKEFDPASPGGLRTLRTLNGDETRSGEFLIMPNDEPDYGGFPIAVTIPARTCIAELQAYWVCEDSEDL
ncbi:hypothetical protein BX600DRAFT_419407 [Xylariales sp. PMI_506]|nr:hypothetical protein BX600DRAFT_419407 [Xylariales sp. PMI_506]